MAKKQEKKEKEAQEEKSQDSEQAQEEKERQQESQDTEESNKKESSNKDKQSEEKNDSTKEHSEDEDSTDEEQDDKEENSSDQKAKGDDDSETEEPQIQRVAAMAPTTAKEAPPQETKPPQSSERTLIYAVIAILLSFFVFFAYSYFFGEDPREPTIEELHQLNLQGELDAEQGVIYNNIHSFVRVDNVWHMQLVSETGQTLYNLAFRFAPPEVEDIPFNGFFNVDAFDASEDYYVTFNPLEQNHSATAVAIGDLNQHLMGSFQKTPIAACDRNETSACVERPIINCFNQSKPVFYIQEAEEARVNFVDKCVHVQGKGFDLTRGVNKVLYTLYGVMDSNRK